MRNSTALKAISYILIPIILVAIIMNIACTFYLADNKDFPQKNSYISTSSFAHKIYQEVRQIEYYIDYIVSPYEDQGVISVFETMYGSNIDFKFLLERKTDNAIFSNITTGMSDIEEVKNSFKNDTYYFIYDDGIATNIANDEIINMNYPINLYHDTEFKVYVSFVEPTDLGIEAFWEEILFDYIKSNGKLLIYTIPLYIVLEIILVIYLLWSIGHKKGEEKIYQTKFDKWPIEIILSICIILDVLFGIMTFAIMDNMRSQMIEINILMFSIASIILSIMYVVTAIVITSIVKKLKTGTLVKTSLVYRICRKIVILIKEIYNTIYNNLNINLKFIGSILAVILASIILCLIFREFGVFLCFIMYGIIIYLIMKKLYQFNKIKETLKEINYGDTTKTINLDEYNGELREIATYINEISSGLENAVNEKLKSERLKTELITNVSHDIKTPLTSIINYVDLLKQENIENEKIKEYINVLDNKSQRLKKLIEDLVEASKASSGNIKLEKQKINVIELVKQTVGEFSDKFNEKNLNVVINTNEKEEYNIQADTRYMYRVVENIFSNIYKYALENSRVYIDIKEENHNIKLEIKNISKEPLNITEEELMERFVRGDKSRNTEGSGLGLSIAKSLIELQNGAFNIVIDGDLFKVEIVF